MNAQIFMSPRALGGGSVAWSAVSGYEAGGLALAFVTAICAVITLVVYMAVTSRKNRTDYDKEIREAEARGARGERDRLQPWIDYYQRQVDPRLVLPPVAPLPDETGS